MEYATLAIVYYSTAATRVHITQEWSTISSAVVTTGRREYVWFPETQSVKVHQWIVIDIGAMNDIVHCSTLEYCIQYAIHALQYIEVLYTWHCIVDILVSNVDCRVTKSVYQISVSVIQQ